MVSGAEPEICPKNVVVPPAIVKPPEPKRREAEAFPVPLKDAKVTGLVRADRSMVGEPDVAVTLTVTPGESEAEIATRIRDHTGETQIIAGCIDD